jgi:hypothetical protein
METESATTRGSDPLRAVADALDAAVKGTKEGIAEAQASAADAFPAASQILSRTVYKTFYSISFGVVFPSLLIARSIPKNNAVVHGLVDGARAAIDLVDEMRPRPATGESHQAAT